jgi:hypothetical protein
VTMPTNSIRPGSIVRGPTLPEPVEVLAVLPFGDALKIIGRGVTTGLTHDPVLAPAQLAQLKVSAQRQPFDGDARLFRLGIEAHRLGLAYEYDPYFSLSIARVDPLPHQLEAVYEYFLRLPRIRFLLADDPGAGKTIMAGLLLKELKARGLSRRTLIVTPANLTFQWQRELADKFREKFDIIRGDVLRANYGQNPWQERSQVITSVSWVSVIDDARESLLRSRWDLVIVDEAHRMEQRVGRIHRYGQEHNCLIFNFVAHNTREGRVLAKLHDRLKEIRRELGTDQVFDVVGEVFPANLLEKLFRDMYARLTDEHCIQDRIVRDVSPQRFRAITESALEGLAKRELNLSAIVGRSAEAKERRLVPEVIEQFFVDAAPETGLHPKLIDGSQRPPGKPGVYRIGKVPRNLLPIGDRQEARFGRLGREYGKVVFDKALLHTRRIGGTAGQALGLIFHRGRRRTVSRGDCRRGSPNSRNEADEDD